MFSFGTPSKEKFARQLQRAIERHTGDGTYAFDREQFRLVRRDSDGEVNLTNLYQEHCTLSRKDRKAHLLGLAAAFGDREEMPDEFEQAKSHLRPKVWLRGSFALLELDRRIKGGQQPDTPLYPLGEHLYSSLVYDTERTMRTIPQSQLEAWGVSYYEALEIALQNLEETTAAFAKIGDNFCSSMTGDNYDASRILLLDRIRSFDLAGEPIAVVPQRDAMYVAGSDDDDALRILFELTAKTIAEQPRPLSPLPLILRDGEWTDWVPPKDHPAREKLDELQLQFFGYLYSEQKPLLDKLYEGRADAPFVATFSAAQENDTQRLRSYCVWSAVEGVEALLPETQLVMFTKDDELAAIGEWDHVRSVVGSLMEHETGLYPPRHRVREFPAAEQLSKIGMLKI